MTSNQYRQNNNGNKEDSKEKTGSIYISRWPTRVENLLGSVFCEDMRWRQYLLTSDQEFKEAARQGVPEVVKAILENESERGEKELRDEGCGAGGELAEGGVMEFLFGGDIEEGGNKKTKEKRETLREKKRRKGRINGVLKAYLTAQKSGVTCRQTKNLITMIKRNQKKKLNLLRQMINRNLSLVICLENTVS